MRPAAVFDLDDTLVASTAGIFSWHDEFVTGHGLGASAKDFLLAQHASPDPPAVTFAKIVAEFGLPVSAEELRAQFLRRWPELVVPVEPAVEAVRALRTRGWRTALLTNGPSKLQAAKATPRLLALFDTVCFAGFHGMPAKPSVVPFRHVATQLGTPVEDCWMVGDSLTTDVAGAHRAGMRSVWLSPSPVPHGTDPAPTFVAPDVPSAVAWMTEFDA